MFHLETIFDKYIQMPRSAGRHSRVRVGGLPRLTLPSEDAVGRELDGDLHEPLLKGWQRNMPRDLMLPLLLLLFFSFNTVS